MGNLEKVLKENGVSREKLEVILPLLKEMDTEEEQSAVYVNEQRSSVHLMKKDYTTVVLQPNQKKIIKGKWPEAYVRAGIIKKLAAEGVVQEKPIGDKVQYEHLVEDKPDTSRQAPLNEGNGQTPFGNSNQSQEKKTLADEFEEAQKEADSTYYQSVQSATVAAQENAKKEG